MERQICETCYWHVANVCGWEGEYRVVSPIGSCIHWEKENNTKKVLTRKTKKSKMGWNRKGVR